ncbi:MAG: hypothetical protein ACYSX1_12790 [Planctomycetota bacterium]|jgi:hypothetical protein
MTIQFYCPNCDSIIAFDSKHAGKHARCLTCGQLFVIPHESYEKPKKVKRRIERGKAVPGFYRAVFIDSWKLFLDPENAISLVFVATVVCFKFFISPVMCCGYITFFVIWGWLLGFYLNIIYETAFEIDKLPQIYLGTSITFLWYIVKPLLTFALTMAAVQLPFIVALALLPDKGLTYENMWQARSGPALLLQMLFILGLFLFPMAILTTAVGQDPALLRPDYILSPIFKAPLPYLTAVALLAATSFLETQTTQYGGIDFATTAGDLGLNLAVQIIAIIAMRAIGLFYRHYSCKLRW